MKNCLLFLGYLLEIHKQKIITHRQILTHTLSYSICLLVCLSIYLSLCLFPFSLSLSFPRSFAIYLYIHLSIFISIYLSLSHIRTSRTCTSQLERTKLQEKKQKQKQNHKWNRGKANATINQRHTRFGRLNATIAMRPASNAHSKSPSIAWIMMRYFTWFE